MNRVDRRIERDDAGAVNDARDALAGRKPAPHDPIKCNVLIYTSAP
jgi:hypothetical protein